MFSAAVSKMDQWKHSMSKLPVSRNIYGGIKLLVGFREVATGANECPRIYYLPWNGNRSRLEVYLVTVVNFDHIVDHETRRH
jgi:hypothetical protein